MLPARKILKNEQHQIRRTEENHPDRDEQDIVDTISKRVGRLYAIVDITYNLQL